MAKRKKTGRPKGFDQRAFMRGASIAERDLRGSEPSTADTRRFWARVWKTNDCWWWDAPDINGYGGFYLRGMVMKAHRLSLLWSRGMPPGDGYDACHNCFNAACVRPDHLRWGTRQENLADDDLARARLKNKVRMTGESHWKARLKVNEVVAIWNAYHSQGATQPALARKFGVSESAICHLCAGRCWSSVTSQLKRGQIG